MDSNHNHPGDNGSPANGRAAGETRSHLAISMRSEPGQRFKRAMVKLDQLTYPIHLRLMIGCKFPLSLHRPGEAIDAGLLADDGVRPGW